MFWEKQSECKYCKIMSKCLCNFSSKLDEKDVVFRFWWNWRSKRLMWNLTKFAFHRCSQAPTRGVLRGRYPPLPTPWLKPGALPPPYLPAPEAYSEGVSPPSRAQTRGVFMGRYPHPPGSNQGRIQGALPPPPLQDSNQSRIQGALHPPGSGLQPGALNPHLQIVFQPPPPHTYPGFAPTRFLKTLPANIKRPATKCQLWARRKLFYQNLREYYISQRFLSYSHFILNKRRGTLIA